MSVLDNQQKLDLQNMINANDTQDVTKQIRENKQSNLIRNDIKQLLFLKQKYCTIYQNLKIFLKRMNLVSCLF